MRIATTAAAVNTGASGRRGTFTSGGGGGGAVTPDLVVSYVDGSGNYTETNVVDGVTSISGVAPFFVKFDMSGSRSTAVDATTARDAFLNLGYHARYGVTTGATWAYPDGTSHTKDADTGPPIFYYVYEAAGTYTFDGNVADSDAAENNITCGIVVAAPTTLTTVNIPVANGAWPTFVSSRYYTLDAGGDYTSFGTMEFDGLHSIVVGKAGSGADPIVSGFTPDSRPYYTSGDRARAVRAHNIDINVFTQSPCGFDHCGAANGRVRHITYNSYQFYWESRITALSETEANAVRYFRGLYFWNTGETNSSTTNIDYIAYLEGADICMHGVFWRHTTTNGGAGEHNFRGVWKDSSIRHSKFVNSVAHKSWIKGIGGTNYKGGQPEAWPSTMRFGDYAYQIANGAINGGPSGAYGVPGQKSFFHHVQFGQASDSAPDQPCGFGPQNNDDDGTSEALDLCGFEDCVAYGTSPIADLGDNFNYTGRDIFHRNIKYDMGAGTALPTSTGSGSIKSPTGYDTGYLIESTNSRPVPSTV